MINILEDSAPRRIGGQSYAMALIDAGLDDELIESLMRPVEPFAESTLRKHAFTKDLYSAFLRALKDVRPPFPLDVKMLCAFIRFLCVCCRYNLHSVQNVYIAALKRMNLMETNTKLSDEENLKIAEMYREMRREGVVNKNDGPGKEPLITTDIIRLASSCDAGSKYRAENISLWLFAHQCGARSVSCEGITLGDIFVTQREPDGEPNMIQIRINITKGRKDWNHRVTLEGRMDEEGWLNAVYWLDRHLDLNHGFSLEVIETLPPERKQDKLWNCSREVMRTRLKVQLDRAGYDASKFGFHSLRSGFMCSALIASELKGNQVDNVMRTTAYVAGWVCGSETQQRYVKELTRSAIVATRLTRGPGMVESLSEEDEEEDTSSPASVQVKPVFEASLLDPEIFHNMKLEERKQTTPKLKLELLRHRFEKEITRGDWTDEEKKFRINVGWREAMLIHTGPTNDALYKRCIEEAERRKAYTDHRQFSSHSREIRIKMGREDICNNLSGNMENLDEVVNHLVWLASKGLNKPHNRRRRIDQRKLDCEDSSVEFIRFSPRKARKHPEQETENGMIEVSSSSEKEVPIEKFKRPRPCEWGENDRPYEDVQERLDSSPERNTRTNPKRWTPKQVKRLIGLKKKGYLNNQIGNMMGFTTQQVNDKVKNLIHLKLLDAGINKRKKK
ncbi:hypothetical protein BLNAU_22328 [Blattamonas nauphoetae]|uniref:Tyr recombinase domain-containing protein n=1 Tax=Blattamonas nauphoetae TaxID=2049346 RepID=A0ABQ9WTA9_9EUKA|nr:hypothetical protein BLNAU_22328 [Blattamonas nauphoetae]